MKRAHIIAKAALIAGVMGTLVVSCGAQDAENNRSQPHFNGQAPGEAQAIFRKLKGSVSAVDTNTMTLTIKLAEGDCIFKVTAKTKLSCGEKPALLKDFSGGKNVEAVIKIVHGRADEAVSVNLILDKATENATGGKDQIKSQK